MSHNPLFIPFPLLETERLILRRVTLADAPMLYAIFSDMRVTRWYDIHTFSEIEQAYALITYFDEQLRQGTGIRWGITWRGKGGLIGTVGYSHIDQAAHLAEISYELGPEVWRQGVMMEALAEALRFGAEDAGFWQVRAVVQVGNRASLRLLERLGFEHGEKQVSGGQMGSDHILIRRISR